MKKCYDIKVMSQSTQIILEQFKLLEIPSLPGLILRGLNLQNQVSSSSCNEALIALLMDDIGLSAKILGGYHSKPLVSPCDAAALLDVVGVSKVQGLVSQSALQSCFRKMKPARLNFYKLHWRQSSLSAIFAYELASHLRLSNLDEARFSGGFLNIGELVLESLNSDEYQLLHENANSEAELVTAELARSAFSHAELGSDLLQSWGLPHSVCDAVRYHHESLGAILDASALVKLCWLANLMATVGLADSKVFAAGQRLFQLEKDVLIKIYTNGGEQLQKNSDSLGFEFSSMTRFPLKFSIDDEDTKATLDADEAALLEISSRVESRSLFNAMPLKLSQSKGLQIGRQEQGPILGEMLSVLFGLQAGIIFYPDEAGEFLLGQVSSQAQHESSELRIKCDKSRSLVAQSFVNAEESQGADNETGRAVIDKQILSLLGMPAMVCDPVIVNGDVLAVLVIGVQYNCASSYLQSLDVRAALKADIAASMLAPIDESKDQSVEARYDQRIRETIHEVNNPLSIIKNYLHLLSMKQGEDSSVLEEIKVIKSEIDRVGSILVKLKDSPSLDNKIAKVDINKIINDLNKVFSASIFSEKELVVELLLDSELPLIYSKENELKQILTNILKNAAEALLVGGGLVIKTDRNIYMNNQHYIQVMISDNGPGISTEAMDVLFLPGNSTKGAGHSGSGLAIVKNLIDDLGGQISCQSNNKGTSFTFLLPTAAGPQEKNNDNA